MAPRRSPGRQSYIRGARVTIQVAASAGVSALTSWWRKAKRRPANFFRSYLDLCILTQQNCWTGLSPIVQTDFTGAEQQTLAGDVLRVRVVDSVGGRGDELPKSVGRNPRQVSFDGRQLPMSGLEQFGVEHLGGCADVWKGDKGGGKRPVGCGDRVLCPFCSDYYHATQAREGIAMVGSLLDAAESKGFARDTWGEHIELTLPKDLSTAVDLLLNLDVDCYRDKVNKLRQAAWRCVNRAVAQACLDAGLPSAGELGGVIVFHHWGSSIPWLPHYHFHVYLLPYTADYARATDAQTGRRELLNWRALPRWWSEKSLDVLRSSWKKAAQRVLQSHYDGEWNAFRGYMSKRSQLLHFMAYQMRAPMRDVWKGVRGDVSSGFEYHSKGKVGRPGKVLPIAPYDLDLAIGRAALVGRELTRVTWYGLLANACQTNTMRQLGLLLHREDIDEGGDMSSKAKFWRPVDVTDLGVLFRATDGSGEVDFVEWNKLKPDPVAGPCDKPIGAKRRRRWVLPGQAKGG